MTSGVGVLKGRHILVVEDEVLVSLMIVNALATYGCIVVGPAGSVKEALALLAKELVDCATLDIKIQDDTSVPVAEALAARGIPFVVATGYADVPPAYKGAPIIRKVFIEHELIDALENVLRR